MKRRLAWPALAAAALLHAGAALAEDWPLSSYEECRRVEAPIIVEKYSELVSRGRSPFGWTVDLLKGQDSIYGPRNAVVVKRYRYKNWHEQCRFEIMGELPVNVIVLNDSGDMAFVLWVRGSGYLLWAIHMRATPPRLVLRAITKSLPQYQMLPDSRWLITTNQSFLEDAPREYEWTGTEFVSRDLPPLPSQVRKRQ